MDIDIGFWLTLLVFVTGIIWLLDRFAGLRGKLGEQFSESIDFSNSLLPVFLVVLVIRSFIVEPFTIPSGSMLPTLKVHDFILVNRFAYGLRLPVTNTKVVPVGDPEHGDVMVFQYPRDPSKNFIKRVAGLPGDRIAIRDDQVYINGEKAPLAELETRVDDGVVATIYREVLDEQPHLMRQEAVINPFTGKPVEQGRDGEWVVPEGHYFVLGDNRDNSNDSRFWGMVPDENVLGRAFLIWMHWKPFLNLPDFSRNGAIDKMEEVK